VISPASPRASTIAAESTAVAAAVPEAVPEAPAAGALSTIEATPAPSRSTARFRLGNLPALTGIRALVIAPVVIYHSNFTALPGAWVSVQFFFALSGFLITSLLAGEGMRRGRISLKRFYLRRMARLAPPVTLTVLLLAVYASLVHVADAAHRLWGDSAAAMFYYADYRQAFGHAPFFGFLAQSWSLSVEEQFYIIWSVLMVIAVAMHRRRLAYGFAILGLMLSIADRLWMVYSAPHFDTAVFARIYFAFDTRADALFLGCLLGLLATDGFLRGWRRWSTRLLAVGAVLSAGFLAWILVAAPLLTETLVVWWLPMSTLAAVVIIAYFVICPHGIGSRMIGIGILVFIGNLSYTIYLVHFPVYQAITPAGTHWSYWPTELARLAVILTIATASWFCIERPLMRWRHRSAGPDGIDVRAGSPAIAPG
jgi:peptidoglycan/LPS O-acetylase OafA/YrhL